MHTYFVSTIRNLAIPKGRADDDGIRAEAVEGEYYYILILIRTDRYLLLPLILRRLLQLSTFLGINIIIISSSAPPAVCQLNPINIIHITTDPGNGRCNDRKSIPV